MQSVSTLNDYLLQTVSILKNCSLHGEVPLGAAVSPVLASLFPPRPLGFVVVRHLGGHPGAAFQVVPCVVRWS